MKRVLIVITLIAAAAVTAWGASPQEVARLGKDLNYAGAEKAGNKEGTIPAWDGKDVPLAGWSHGKYRGDYWKFKDEKPLFSIDASNVDKYKDKLSPAQVQWIKQTKGYRMDVYPSHRNAGYPDWIEANIRKNAEGGRQTRARTAPICGRRSSRNPVSVSEETGSEIIWNFLDAVQGRSESNCPGPPRRSRRVPAARSGSTPPVRSDVLPLGEKGINSSNAGQRPEHVHRLRVRQPGGARRAADLHLRLHDTRIASRSSTSPASAGSAACPSYAYDAPQIGFENQYPLDTAWVFLGTARPVRLEDRRQEGDVRPVQQLRYVRLPEEASRRAPAEAPGQREPPL